MVIGIMALAFRSLWVLFISILPNLFPIVAAGFLIYLADIGLGYASVIALTVAFGLSVDDCIHFLARYRLAQSETSGVRTALNDTLTHIGPVLILTTGVLIAGLAVTGLSNLPAMRLFGILIVVTLLGALLADLIILPAMIAISDRIFGKKNAISRTDGAPIDDT